ncbi:DUF5133 domain-containing protein [Streptomyces sp. NPDC058045]|uniref:DUF5133 domain-containing protein n=1 Tax=Streptomyces sp. NPDC058045 TaxID=3346311 RepID=UPI0036E23585
MLLPGRAQVARLLRRYRRWERLLMAAPHNEAVRRHLEDTAYTLCILMGRRTAPEAVRAAEEYLAATRRPRGHRHGSGHRDTARGGDLTAGGAGRRGDRGR